jgi:hypothetical protein
MINIKSIRLQERTFVDNLAHEAEQAASHGEMSILQSNKQLCGKTPQPAL